MRTIHVNEDLRGATLTGPFMYIGNCTLGEKGGKLTTYIGDCTAADFINNDGPADYSKADTYAAQWRGNTNMNGSVFPVNIGYLHHEPVAEILRQGIAKATGIERTILEGLPAWVVADYSFHSWDTGWSEYASKILGATPESFISALMLAVKGYSQLETHVEQLGKALLGGTLEPMTRMPSKVDIVFDDGVKRVDSESLPALVRPLDRVELAEKITSKELFFYSVLPPVPYIHGRWKKFRRGGW